jgi:hypothetical protein
MASYHPVDTQYDRDRFPRQVALLYGVVFLVVGIAGFIPGITTHYGDMQFAGHMSGAKLLGLFMVSVLHNLIHLAFGVVGILVSRRSSYASALYLLLGGVVYAVVWIYGLAVGDGSDANFVPLNTADNWLHFLLAITMIGLGLVSMRRGRTVTAH